MKSEQRIQRFFSPLIIAYGLIVLAVLGFIIYVAFSKTTIIVTLSEPDTSYAFSYSAEDLDGTMVTAPITHETIFTDYDGEAEDGIARGSVTLVNNYSADQPLVETTRLLSEDGVLFRTDETVTVPAGGSVTVPVYADQAGASGNVGPTKFEIVALWNGLKDNIYGESSQTMSGGIIKRVTLTEALAEQAEIQATTELPQAATTTLQTAAADGTVDPDLIVLENTATTITPAIGETSDSITVITTATASTIVFDPTALTALLLNNSPTADINQLTYSLTRTDAGGMRITGSVPLPTTPTTLDFIDRADLTSKTPQQIQDELLSFEQVQAVEVQITPFWATRSPSLEQQIHLQMAQLATPNE